MATGSTPSIACPGLVPEPRPGSGGHQEGESGWGPVPMPTLPLYFSFFAPHPLTFCSFINQPTGHLRCTRQSAGVPAMRPRLAFREVTDKERDPCTLREPPFTQQSYQGVLGSSQTMWNFCMMIRKSQSSAAVLETLDICVAAWVLLGWALFSFPGLMAAKPLGIHTATIPVHRN